MKNVSSYLLDLYIKNAGLKEIHHIYFLFVILLNINDYFFSYKKQVGRNKP